MEATNTLEFCTSCHEMRDNMYPDYIKSAHYSNPSGVRAICSDCHVPKQWIPKLIRKIRASNELYHWAVGSVNTPEKFDKQRLRLARHVWDYMKASDSRELESFM
jgi:nitrate/TMAO reductase-like tetraheme cytochrome c subunit